MRVNTVICAPLLIMKENWLSICYIKWNLKTRTSTCFTLKQYGVPTVTLITLVIPVSMLTIGKIIGGSHIFMIMIRNNAKTGKWRLSSKIMQLTAVKTSTDAEELMVGKNRSIILWTTKFTVVVSAITATNSIVLTIILKKIEGCQYQSNTELFLKTEEDQDMPYLPLLFVISSNPCT